MAFEGPMQKKRLIMTPEIYLKDLDKLHEDLRIKETVAQEWWQPKYLNIWIYLLMHNRVALKFKYYAFNRCECNLI